MSKSALKILSTAERLFNQHSFTGVGVDLIRDESGCSKTTMYTYYKNKNQLVNAVLVARDQHFKEQLLAFVGEQQGKEALYKILDWHIQWFKKDDFKGCLFVRAVAEANDVDQALTLIVQQHKQWIKELIFTHCVHDNRAQISDLIYTLIEGLISRFLVDGFDQQVIQNIKYGMDLILDEK